MKTITNRTYYNKGNVRFTLRKVECGTEECTICSDINFYLTRKWDFSCCSLTEKEQKKILAGERRLKGLAKGNLKQHLATGKHWEVIERTVSYKQKDGSWESDQE